MWAQRINRLARRIPSWVVYVLALLPVFWLTARVVTGHAGIDPVKTVEHRLGLLALQFIVAALCITPLMRLSGINLVKFRRAVGLSAFYYALLHFLAWLVLDMGLLVEQALRDIVKRPYVTVGMLALAALVPLAVTSNDWSVRRLGAARWRKLQKLAYPAAVAAAIHYVWLVKAWPLEPFLYLGAILGLLAMRAFPRRTRAMA